MAYYVPSNTYVKAYVIIPGMRTKETDLSVFFKALADRTRLRLINLIDDREVCVCFFVELIGTHQPKISRHLAYLRRAGIVTARRDGKWMHYRIAEPANPDAREILHRVRDWLRNEHSMQKERKRLENICCGTPAPKHLRQAPVPIASNQ